MDPVSLAIANQGHRETRDRAILQQFGYLLLECRNGGLVGFLQRGRLRSARSVGLQETGSQNRSKQDDQPWALAPYSHDGHSPKMRDFSKEGIHQTPFFLLRNGVAISSADSYWLGFLRTGRSPELGSGISDLLPFAGS
jgi:hypothetical protein